MGDALSGLSKALARANQRARRATRGATTRTTARAGITRTVRYYDDDEANAALEQKGDEACGLEDEPRDAGASEDDEIAWAYTTYDQARSHCEEGHGCHDPIPEEFESDQFGCWCSGGRWAC